MAECKFEVHPKVPIVGVLPNNRRINEPTVLTLNRAEFLKCMSFGTVYALVGNDKVLVTDMDYQKALSLFKQPVKHETKQIKLTSEVPTYDKVHRKPNPAPAPMPVKIVNEDSIQQSEEELTVKKNSVSETNTMAEEKKEEITHKTTQIVSSKKNKK